MNTSEFCTHATIGYTEPVVIKSVTVTETRLEIVKRKLNNIVFACNPPIQMSDVVWKEIYEVVNGHLVRQADVAGIHTPAHTVPESIVWEDQKK